MKYQFAIWMKTRQQVLLLLNAYLSVVHEDKAMRAQAVNKMAELWPQIPEEDRDALLSTIENTIAALEAVSEEQLAKNMQAASTFDRRRN